MTWVEISDWTRISRSRSCNNDVSSSTANAKLAVFGVSSLCTARLMKQLAPVVNLKRLSSCLNILVASRFSNVIFNCISSSILFPLHYLFEISNVKVTLTRKLFRKVLHPGVSPISCPLKRSQAHKHGKRKTSCLKFGRGSLNGTSVRPRFFSRISHTVIQNSHCSPSFPTHVAKKSHQR